MPTNYLNNRFHQSIHSKSSALADLHSRSMVSAIAIAASIVIGGACTAQGADGEGEEALVFEEVVVTALRKSQRVIDVGATISALTVERLRESRFEQVKDISAGVPNIDIRETLPGVSPVITIRGVGLDDFSTTNSPAVGVAVDDVPLASIALMNGDFFDVARVEVLKGPQGTLYGRNTVGGAVNIVSQKPTDEFDAYVNVGYGNFKTFDAEAMVNFAVSETVALRFSGKTIQQNEGFWKSNRLATGELGERDFGQRDIWLGRAQFAFTPSDDLSFNLSYDGSRVRSEMGQYEQFGTFGAGTPFVPCGPFLNGQTDNSQCVDAFGYSDQDSDPYRGDWANELPYNIDQHMVVLNTQLAVGEFDFTSITGYIDFDRLYRIDVDASFRPQLDFIQRDQVKQFTQELRVARSFETVDWIAGAFYSYDKATGNNTNILEEIPFTLFGFTPQQGETTFDQSTNSAAGFINGTWHINDRLKLVTGLRYTWEERDYSGGSYYPVPAPFLGIDTTFIDEKISDKNWSWTLGFNYSLGEDSLLYGSVSKGTKSGGFVTRFTTSNSQLTPYEPEKLISYEIGAKTQLDTIALSAAAFYYDFTGVQTQIRVTEGTVPVERLGNIPGSSKLYGADMEATWHVTERLMLNAGLGLLKSELNDFQLGADTFTNNAFPNAPEVTFNSLARYEAPVSENMNLAIQVNAVYRDSAFKDAANDAFVQQDAHWIVNARAALITADDGGWEAAIWVKNLTDKLYTVSGSNLGSLGFIDRTVNPPRTYGLSLSWRY